MKMILTGAAALIILAACSTPGGAGYTGPANAIQGQVSTPFGADFNGMNLSVTSDQTAIMSEVTPEGGHVDIGSTMKMRADGTLEVTGPAVWLWGMANVCRSAPDAGICHGSPLPE